MERNVPKFKIAVRRILREDTVVEVEAESEDAAKKQALLIAPNLDGWEGYDCEYWTD